MGEQVSYSIPEAVESSTGRNVLMYFDKAAFDAVVHAKSQPLHVAALFAQMARFNALYMVARAGSGHLGSSFSSLDIVSWLYLNILKPEDRYFSSKGHDSPGLYAVQTALGIIAFEKIHALRRLGGLPGHPDVNTPGAHTNTGSLGMGVSKAKGFLFADDLLGRQTGRIIVMTGDGELQEGQFWESLITASIRRDGRLTIVVDHNKIQSDTFVSRVSDLGDLDAKFRAFGMEVLRCDGHDFSALNSALDTPERDGVPKVIIADTIKGKGVSFMEHTSMPHDQTYYRYHSGAPCRDDYLRAAEELLLDINQKASRIGIVMPRPIETGFDPVMLPEHSERMIPSYSEAILIEASANPRLVALDADLILDTGLIPFQNQFCDRFVECGIAEQDMISQAGTMALAGLLPVVHSFACFLTSRGSEQIYNNCTQGGRIVYVGSLAGVLPGGPGHSHQAVRDITAMSGMPGITIIEPVCAGQVGPALHWAVNDNLGSTYLRLTSIPYEKRNELSGLNSLMPGRGSVVREGSDTTIVALGAIMTCEALKAADLLLQSGIGIKVIATPWGNIYDESWFCEHIGSEEIPLVILENHYMDGGFSSQLIQALITRRIVRHDRIIKAHGLIGVPVCGTNQEVLKNHRLDAESIASLVMELIVC